MSDLAIRVVMCFFVVLLSILTMQILYLIYLIVCKVVFKYIAVLKGKKSFAYSIDGTKAFFISFIGFLFLLALIGSYVERLR